MSGSTSYLGLIKAAEGEAYNVNIVNDNLDKVDAETLRLKNWDKGDRQLVFSNGGFAWGANATWDAGVLSIDTSAGASSQLSSPQPAFAAPGSASGTLKFLEAGNYDIRWDNGPDAAPGESGYSIETSGSWPGPVDTANGRLGQTLHPATGKYWETTVLAINVRVPIANLEIIFKGVQANATTNVPRIKIFQKAKF
jgi:hypothetical protein